MIISSTAAAAAAAYIYIILNFYFKNILKSLTRTFKIITTNFFYFFYTL